MKTLWEELAATEMRLQLMSELLKYNVGLSDIEEFNFNLKGNLKNVLSEKVNEAHNQKFVKVAMDIKIKDEQSTRNKLVRSRNISRTKMMKEFGRNTKRYRTIVRELRQAAWDKKAEYKLLYDEKLEHLRCKYRETEQEKMDRIPAEMQEYITLSIFDREKYERVEELTYEVTCIGDVHLSNKEKSIIKMHPTFSIIDKTRVVSSVWQVQKSTLKWVRSTRARTRLCTEEKYRR